MQHTQEQNARRLTQANRGETGIGATLMTSCEGGGAICWPCRIVITNGTTADAFNYTNHNAHVL
jgi:hypothetical protein